MPRLLIILFFLTYTSAMSQQTDSRYQPQKYVELTNPDWVKNATIYELNIRQFSQEGTSKP